MLINGLGAVIFRALEKASLVKKKRIIPLNQLGVE